MFALEFLIVHTNLKLSKILFHLFAAIYMKRFSIKLAFLIYGPEGVFTAKVNEICEKASKEQRISLHDFPDLSLIEY
jgi:hypothetical protein